MFTCIGCWVTLWDSIWQGMLYSSQLISHEELCTATFFLNFMADRNCNVCSVLVVGDLYIFYAECFVKDYNDHISEISNKLVAIMDSMLEMNISKV